MTAVLSGTNGLLQSYDYQVLTTGFSYTFAAGTQVLVINPAGTLATGTITMPAAPVDGMTITFSSSQQITALTMAGNGASLVGAVTFLPAKTGVTYVYRATGTTWFPTATVPGTGSQLVQGTSVASTSGTSITFTGIPSWAKRVTVMLQGVSGSATATLYMQIGSGSLTTSGYLGGGTYLVTAAGINASTYWPLEGVALGAASLRNGIFVVANITGNTWVMSGLQNNSNDSGASTANGSLALSGALDRVSIALTAGSFDAGSINILFE